MNKCPICNKELLVDEEYMADNYGSAYWDGVLDEKSVVYFCKNCIDDHDIVGTLEEIGSIAEQGEDFEYPTPEEESEFVADILGDAYTEDQLGDLPEEFDFENGYINILRNKFQKKELSLVEYLNMLEQFCLKVEEMVKENTGHPCRVEISFYGHYEQNGTMFDDTEGFGIIKSSSTHPNFVWREGKLEKVIVYN